MQGMSFWKQARRRQPSLRRRNCELRAACSSLLQILHILLYGSLSGVQAISGTGASTVVIHRCRFEFMTYTALRISDSTMLSISHSMFDKNGSVLTLGEAGSGKPCHASERTQNNLYNCTFKCPVLIWWLQRGSTRVASHAADTGHSTCAWEVRSIRASRSMQTA